MYVQEIILQGFKTYMNRTVISGYDPQFNAITGLNGSGKSNILDAIQFLLGSTSKEMLRLKTGLTELIYKEGFAGIQKASVTIKFRCTDKNMRPTGYENCDELIVTRQITKDKLTKFFVNGINSNLSKVRNLFRSVQLNIQNPHFLVKQGQITKIINLKPLELLGMIEETAGTAYYNKTKLDSQKIIQRKQQKLQSINQILQTTIKPQMEKLQSDRKKYAAFKDKQTLAERLNSKIKKHQYAIKLLQTRNKQYKITLLKQNLQKNTAEMWQLSERLVETNQKISLLKTKGDTEFLKDYNQLKNLILEKENSRRTIRNRLQIIQDQSYKLKEQTMRNQQQLQRLKNQTEWFQRQLIQSERQYEQFNDLIIELQKSKSVQESLKLIQKQIRQEQSVILNLKQQLKLLEQKKQSIRNQTENQNKSIQDTKESIRSLENSLQEIENELQKFRRSEKPNPVEDPQLGAQELRKLQNEKKRIIQENHRLGFYFNQPYSGFNRNLVKGKLFMIFKVKDRVHQKALEIGAGFKLFNVVVENEQASQALLKAESFGPNVTIIPNNKIRFTNIKPECIKYAEQVAKQFGGLAKAAYELVDFPKDLHNTIMFSFGNFMVCSSPQIAKKIAYNSNRGLSCKCVTYQGDIFQQGTLTGGSDMNQQFILPKYYILRQIEQRMKVERGKFEQKSKLYQNYQKKINDYRIQQKQNDSRLNRKEKIKQKLSSLSLNMKPRDYTEEIDGIQKKVTELKKEIIQHETKVQDLTNKNNKGKGSSVQEQKKSIENDRKKCERKIAESKKKISINEVEMQRISNNLKVAENTEKQYSKEIIQLERAQSKIIDDTKQNKIKFQQLQAKKIQYEKEMALNNNQIQLLNHEIQQIKRKQQSNEENIKSMKFQIDNLGKEITNNERILTMLLRENPWLENQRAIQVDSEFRYEESLKEYNQILMDVDKLRKTVKVNVDDHSYQKLTEQYKNLLEKKGILQNDKRTLLTNMHELDEKRTKTLEKCFECVKNNLGSIFNDLLPGATAHLSLMDENDVTQGAELRVHFNKVKKELSELSGGQRSLLALSFILALLLYKPSPFYILDQIDSALDLSHTENIGYMISKRFPQSQFILISLKEGMFQNANVLYKVHFAEGQSKVDRQVLKKKI